MLGYLVSSPVWSKAEVVRRSRICHAVAAMRRFVLTVAVCMVAGASSAPRPAHASVVPQVDNQLLDSSGQPTGGTLEGPANVHVNATVTGAGAPPTGSITYRRFTTADCTGASFDGPTVELATQTVVIEEAADYLNASGWDSATAWSANGVDYVMSNWSGGLYAGNDNTIFSSSSMGWRFRGVPLRASDVVTRAYLSLRVRKSRPNLASEGASTWSTVLAVDKQDGSDFEGETRATFLARFATWGAFWQVPLSSAVADPFGTDDGASYAASPDITDLVESRVSNPSWTPGGSIALAVLNHGTFGVAEAEVTDEPGYARLHIEWTTTDDVRVADSGALTPVLGVQSYQAYYNGDANYSAAAGPCMTLTVLLPEASVTSVGGSAAPPELAALPSSVGRRRHGGGASSGLLPLAVAGFVLALRYLWRRRTA